MSDYDFLTMYGKPLRWWADEVDRLKEVIADLEDKLNPKCGEKAYFLPGTTTFSSAYGQSYGPMAPSTIRRPVLGADMHGGSLTAVRCGLPKDHAKDVHKVNKYVWPA